MRGGNLLVNALAATTMVSLLSGCHWFFATPDTVADAAMADASVLDATAADADAPTDRIGCSDGTREGFASLDAFPAIAGCEGGWSIAGMRTGPQCKLQSGNNGAQAAGLGCAAADLCAEGWHVCSLRSELSLALGNGSCDGATQQPNAFFATTLGSAPSTSWVCDDLPTATDDLYGCGTHGTVPPSPNPCAPLTRGSGNACSALDMHWRCPATQGTTEQTTVTKTAGPGGVLCCKLQLR